jgi:hypothetical protein
MLLPSAACLHNCPYSPFLRRRCAPLLFSVLSPSNLSLYVCVCVEIKVFYARQVLTTYNKKKGNASEKKTIK